MLCDQWKLQTCQKSSNMVFQTCGLHVVYFFEEINRAGILVILVCKNKPMILQIRNILWQHLKRCVLSLLNV